MTLILAITSPEAVWLAADRRLSYPGRLPREDARKVMFLDSNEDTAILGYSGLGATALGTEPCDWMSAVLRGRFHTIEESLSVLADALRIHLAPHLRGLRGGGVVAHHIYAPCLIAETPKFYTIDYLYDRRASQDSFRFTRHIVPAAGTAIERTPRIGLSGSGALFLRRHLHWRRPLLSLVSANDHGRIQPTVLADRIASICYEAHLATPDGTVGHRSIVAWRYRRHGHHRGGGGHRCYTKGVRERDVPPLPSIVNGMDFNAIGGVIRDHMIRSMNRMPAGSLGEWNNSDVWTDVSSLPSDPDPTLR